MHPEDVDRVVDDRPHVGEPPGLPLEADAGDLDRHLRRRRDELERTAPAREPLCAAVRGQERVIDDNRRLRMPGDQVHELGRMPPRRLQLEVQAMARQQRIASLPLRIGHGARGPLFDTVGRGRRCRLMSYAPHQREGSVAGQHVLNVAAIEEGAGNMSGRRTVGRGDLAHPAALGDGIGFVPLSLHRHRGDDAMTRRDRPVVGRQKVSLERRVVAIAERDHRLVAEPGVVVPVEIPEVMMGIDDRDIAIRHGPRSVSP